MSGSFFYYLKISICIACQFTSNFLNLFSSMISPVSVGGILISFCLSQAQFQYSLYSSFPSSLFMRKVSYAVYNCKVADAIIGGAVEVGMGMGGRGGGLEWHCIIRKSP